MDESLFNQKQVQKRAWSNKHANITPLLMLHYEPCLAVCGAVSTRRGWVHALFNPKSMKGPDFIEFLTQLKAKTPHPFAILLDNASIHKTVAVKKFCNENEIEMMFNVPYTPWFNGIEEVWAMAKRHFKREMLKGQMEKQVYLREAVNGALRSLEKNKVIKCAARAQVLIERA